MYVPDNFKPVPDRGRSVAADYIPKSLRAVPGYANPGERDKGKAAFAKIESRGSKQSKRGKTEAKK